jgi:hypothetical protein
MAWRFKSSHLPRTKTQRKYILVLEVVASIPSRTATTILTSVERDRSRIFAAAWDCLQSQNKRQGCHRVHWESVSFHPPPKAL